MPDIWLTDIEQTKKILVLEESNKELLAELKQVRTDYERTREIVDELVLKFVGHRHSKRDEREGKVENNYYLGSEKFTGLPVK